MRLKLEAAHALIDWNLNKCEGAGLLAKFGDDPRAHISQRIARIEGVSGGAAFAPIPAEVQLNCGVSQVVFTYRTPPLKATFADGR